MLACQEGLSKDEALSVYFIQICKPCKPFVRKDILVYNSGAFTLCIVCMLCI